MPPSPGGLIPPLQVSDISARRHGHCSFRSQVDGERGALSLMVVVLFVALAALAGIVVDGGSKLAADENAVALAQEAARAGATTVNVSSAYTSGVFVVDQRQALAAARSYLTDAGYDQFTVSAIGLRAIRVNVTITEPTSFLSLIGVDSFTSTGTATASLVTAVTGGS
jgi:Putative Tad-like Flp pilus-assembly